MSKVIDNIEDIASIDTKVDKVTSTDNAIARYDGTGGAIQNSSVIIDDSGNVGIGTSSPSYKIDINNPSNGNMFNASYTGGTKSPYIRLSVSNDTLTQISTGNSDNSCGLNININGSDRMRIDSSGNVGIGVTPSAWNNSFRVQDISSYGSLFSYTNGQYTGLTNNAYFSSSGWLYKNSFYATMYHQGLNGQHQWHIAPSGTAGSNITWTQPMTLNANGNLLVGTTTDNGADILQVNGSITFKAIGASDANTLTRSGYFSIATSTPATSNIPANNVTIEVIATPSYGWVTQKAIEILGQRLWIRTSNNMGVSWTAWVEK